MDLLLCHRYTFFSLTKCSKIHSNLFKDFDFQTKKLSWVFLYNIEKNYWMSLPWSVGEIENDLSFNWRIYACPYFVVLFNIFILFFSQSSSRHWTINYCRHFSWVCHWPCCFFLCYNRHHHHKVNVNCVHLHAIF